RLTGWRREFCVELLGDGGARIFVRAVEKSSFKAAELQRAILFHRLDSRFRDLEGCVEAIRPDLVCLVDAARRTRPDRGNLFASVEYDRAAWESVKRRTDPANLVMEGGRVVLREGAVLEDFAWDWIPAGGIRDYCRKTVFTMC
ncbi:MAG: hypothetical protein HC794_02185, partial [Nitrospiraceae bacterium]|nr:hypothetical protein [Nitrospiraceae bacterium]